jgi:peptidoglycan/LPS O-acetylase OafA/YrhL
MGLFLAAFGLAALAALVAATVLASLLERSGFPLPGARGRIGCIDGLRGYLALSVMLHHFVLWCLVQRFGALWSPPQIAILNQLGAGGVALFFMTTGLVFYPRVLAGARKTDWLTVYVTRTFRILPLVIVSIAGILTIIALRTHASLTTADFTALIKWVTAWSEPPLLGYQDSGRVNAYVLWSLWYEWVFYFVILPVCALAMDWVVARGLPSWTVPAALLIGSISAQILARFVGHPVDLFRYLPLFAVGMLAFECQQQPRIRSQLMKRWMTFVASGALVAGMTLTAVPYGGSLPLFAMFFICVAGGNNFHNVLQSRGALVLGECSFGIYLLHGLCLDALFSTGTAIAYQVSTVMLPLFLVLLALIVPLIAAATYLAVERPAMRLGRSLASWLAGKRVKTPAQELDLAP